MQRMDTSAPNSPSKTPQPPKLLERMRTHLRARHYSLRTETAYLDWVRRFILFHHKRHPQDMGRARCYWSTGYALMHKNHSYSGRFDGLKVLKHAEKCSETKLSQAQGFDYSTSGTIMTKADFSA